MDEDAAVHPWKETKNRWPDDGWLRENGFTIAARPKVGPTLWKRDGTEYTESDALMFCETQGIARKKREP
jgi:hypothetical protein